MYNSPYQSVKNTAAITGLSVYYLRNGCKNGTVPHIMSGKKILINVPKLLDRLNAECAGQGDVSNAGN